MLCSAIHIKHIQFTKQQLQWTEQNKGHYLADVPYCFTEDSASQPQITDALLEAIWC